MASSSRRKALLLQKRIFRSLKAEAELLIGEMPSSIRQYEKECFRDFTSSLKKPLEAISKEELLQHVRMAEITFIADFHTFNQAQRTALRIIREAVTPDQFWMIGTELIPTHFQNVLDEFQSGKISVEAFHETIGYDETWGFPWKNYSPIFEWARENNVKLIALNRPPTFFLQPESRELHERDQWAAGVITDLFNEKRKQGLEPKMIVLYGEHHVGTQHLPKQLETISRRALSSPLSWVTIHQNHDRLYWHLAEKQIEIQNHSVKLRKNVFCVFSGTPWAKLQSFVSWVEGEAPSEDTELVPDYLSIMRAYGQSLSEFFSLSLPSFENLTVHTIEQADFLEKLTEDPQLSQRELRLIRFHVQNNHRLYISRHEIAYLGSPSLNGAAELSAIHILKGNNPQKSLFKANTDDFFRLVLEASFGFLGSLILNPHRKCDFLTDHLKRISNLHDGEKPAFPLEDAARKIAAGVIRNRPFPGFSLNNVFSETRLIPAAMIAAKYIGQILAKKLNQAMLSDSVEIQTIRHLYFQNLGEEQYNALLNYVSHIPVSPSKTDTL